MDADDWLTAELRDAEARCAQLTAELAEAHDALAYITRPSMGWSGQTDIQRFIYDEATEFNVRAALYTCVNMARQVMKGKPNRGIW